MSENRCILKNWLSKKNGENKWGWQVIVDALAIGESVPLRIICYSSLKDLYGAIVRQLPQQECDSFKINYPTKLAWDSYVKEVINWTSSFENKEIAERTHPNLETLTNLVKVYPFLAHNIFPVLPANPFPMEMLSRISFDEYRVFCLLWFYYWIIIDGNVPQKNAKPMSRCITRGALNFATMNTASQWVVDDNPVYEHSEEVHKNWLMIFGPSFSGNISMFSEAEYDNETIKPVIGFIENFSHSISQEKLFHKHRFRRAAHEATPLPVAELERRQQRVNNALALLLTSDITKLNGTPTRHDLYHMTMWSLFNSLRSKEIKSILSCRDHKLIFHHGTDYSPKIKSSLQAHEPACLTVSLGKEDHLQLSVLDESSVIKLSDIVFNIQIDRYGFVLQSDHELEKNQEKLLNNLRTQCSRFYLRVYRKNRSLDNIRLMIISDRLHRELGGVNLSKQNREPGGVNLSKQNETVLLSGICQWLSGLLRSESTILFTYTTHKKPFGSFEIADKYSRTPSNEEHLIALSQDMTSISTQEELEKSLTYRAVAENCAKICLMYSPETQEAVPDGHILYHSKSNKKFSFRSAIAVPVRFNGRRQGVIEVTAKQSWHFSWGQQVVMEQAASVIAPYFYHQRFLLALNDINQNVVNFHREGITESELYDHICYALANMFLCDGACFWVRKENETHKFERKGIHNIQPHLGEVNLNQKGLIPQMLVKMEQPNFNKVFTTHPFSEIEIDAPEIENLSEQKIQYFALLPLLETSSPHKNKVMAFVTLYARDETGFKESWNGIMRYMGGFLPFLVEAVNAFVHERIAISNVVQHEIWHDATYLVNKANDIARERSDLKHRLTQLVKLVEEDWFVDRLEAAEPLSHLWSKEIRSIKDLKHSINTSWFLPQKDMLHYAGTLKTRTSALFNDKEFDRESKKLLSEIGDRYIVKLVRADEKEEHIYISSVVNRFISKHEELRRKRLYFYNPGFPNEESYVMARPTILDTVLRNLLDNAIKYSATNTVISLEIEERRRGGLRLIIENEGLAMDDLNECHFVMKKGFRGTNSRGIQGLGLGLYAVQKLCQYVLRIDFRFDLESRKNRPKVHYFVTLDIPANRVGR
jgi:signal transduction histidine kinase